MKMAYVRKFIRSTKVCIRLWIAANNNLGCDMLGLIRNCQILYYSYTNLFIFVICKGQLAEVFMNNFDVNVTKSFLYSMRKNTR